MKFFQCKKACCPKLTPTSEDYKTFILEDDDGVSIDIDIPALEKRYVFSITNGLNINERPMEIKDIMTEKVAKMTWEQFETIFIIAKALELDIDLTPVSKE